MSTATPLGPSQGFKGQATVYRLDPPYRDPTTKLLHGYVVAVSFDRPLGSAHNLAVFPSDGFAVTSPAILMYGSYESSGLVPRHDIVLTAMGYEIEREEEDSDG